MHDILLIGLRGLGALCLVLLPIGLYFGVEKRRQQHSERMKALELGRPFPAPETDLMRCMAGRIAFSIGAGVPIGVFGCAWLASLAVGYHDAIWIAATMVGVASVICGTALAAKMFEISTAASKCQSSDSFSDGKPVVEEDAYDVVSARGCHNPSSCGANRVESTRLNF